MQAEAVEIDPLKTDPRRLRYRALIGTGGIGSGAFFALSGNHTLGREESRGGRFLDRRDYCKLHITTHYLQALLGDSFRTIPIGRVGEDEVGRRLLAEMSEAGLDVSHVARAAGETTLYSFCFLYPDGTGGNLTTDDSASAHVDGALVREAEEEFARYRGEGIALAVPEVPLEARAALLELGGKYDCFRAASFTTEELAGPTARAMLGEIDLLAVNLEEAAAGAGLSEPEGMEPRATAEAAVAALSRSHPGMLISVTAGSRGSWSWDGSSLLHCPSCRAEVQSTAGAGDAHLAGIVVGLAAGLSLAEAQQLATLVAGLSVTSPHTINREIGRESLRAFAARCGLPLAPDVSALLES